MVSTKALATALVVTVALVLSGLQPAEAQPGARFQDQGMNQASGYPAFWGPYYPYRYWGRGYAYWGPAYPHWRPGPYAYRRYRYRPWW
ncbi:MAG TPA: hypothetical protein VH684_14460 [Xanthobacteraceae bacterium]|jgi:hypothetical protein